MTTHRIRSGITDISITSFKQWLVEEYATYSPTKLNAAFVRNVSDLRSFRATTGEQRPSESQIVEGSRDKDSVAFPRIHMTLGAISLDGERAGFKKRYATGGLQIGRDTHAGEAYFESARPVKLDLGATFFADNLDDILCYTTMLFEAAPKLSLYIEDDDTGFKFEIGVAIEGDLTIPQADTSTTGDPFMLETVFRLNTFVGIVSKQRLIRSISINTRAGGATEPNRYFQITNLPIHMQEFFNYYDLYRKNSYHYKGTYSEVSK